MIKQTRVQNKFISVQFASQKGSQHRSSFRYRVTHLAEINLPPKDGFPLTPMLTNVPLQVDEEYIVHRVRGAKGIAELTGSCRFVVHMPSIVIRVTQFPVKFTSVQIRISAKLSPSDSRTIKIIAEIIRFI